MASGPPGRYAAGLRYAQNIRALVEVAGIDHVCLGTDTKLTLPNCGGPRPGSAPRPNSAPGDKALGGPPSARSGKRTNQAWADQQAGFYYAVVAALLRVGFTKDEIGKVSGGNFCRVFGAATGRHH